MAVGTLSKGIDFLEERVELGVGSCVVDGKKLLKFFKQPIILQNDAKQKRQVTNFVICDSATREYMRASCLCVHYGINIINDIIMHTDLRHL